MAREAAKAARRAFEEAISRAEETAGAAKEAALALTIVSGEGTRGGEEIGEATKETAEAAATAPEVASEEIETRVEFLARMYTLSKAKRAEEEAEEAKKAKQADTEGKIEDA